MPASSRLRSASSPTFGMSRVMSSGPSLVSRAMTSNSSMWIEVKTSSFTIRSEIRIESSIVVAVPRHERDEHVAAQRQLAELGRRAVGDDVAGSDQVAHLHQRTLVDAGVLVRALELHQRVDVDARLAGLDVVGGAHDDAGRVDLVDDAACGGRRSRRRNRGRRSPPCRCRRTAPRRESAAPPGAACSSPSARGWRHRSRGTGSATRRPRRAAWG